MRILFIGDICDQRGLEALERFLPVLKQETNYQMLLVNGENMAQGLGLEEKDYKSLMKLGVQGVTLGNHGFSKKDILNFIDDANIVRAVNYPKGTPGKDVLYLRHNEETVALISIMGRVFMHDPLNNPFESIDSLLEEVSASIIIVDVHAETTSEKLALAHYLDGRVTAVVGTHTHVATLDAMKLPKGTLYMTDLGMTGVKFGIIGADKDLVLKKFTTGMPIRLRPSKDKKLQINGALIDTEKKSIRAIHHSDN